MTLVTAPPIGVVPVKAGRIPRRADVTLVVWFGRAVGGDVEAVRVEERVEPAGFPEERVGLGDGRAFVRPAVCL